MNWHHLRTMIWLRWRLSVNQGRKAGVFGQIILGLFLFSIVATSLITFLVALIGGIFVFDEIAPDIFLLIWDAIVVIFLFVWMIGLITELQRSEIVSIEKMLHLPISLSNAFVLNYLSSLFSLSSILFVPGMIGICLALVIAEGPKQLFMLPLVVTFLLMVTAITYQFRGWLATLMVNKRRKRTVITVVTMGFLVLTQTPNLINFAVMRLQPEMKTNERSEIRKLDRRLAEKEIDREQYSELREALNEQRRQDRNELFKLAVGITKQVNLAIPIGWLPYGAYSIAAGSVWPAVLCSLGMGAIGLISLRRCYWSMLRFYTGANSKTRARRRDTGAAPGKRKVKNRLEGDVPGVTDPITTVMHTTLWSVLRAPEAKVLLLTPLILVILFGSLLLFGSFDRLPESARPYIALAAIGTTMFGFAQLVLNLFGFDRQGFRAFVLMPVPRNKILIGKNLGLAPLLIGMSIFCIIAVQIVIPLKFTHLVALLVQVVPVFLLASIVGNWISMLAPFPVAAGTLKPANMKILPTLIQMLGAMLLPTALLPAVAALGVEQLLEYVGWFSLPIFLLVSMLECAAVLWCYPLLMQSQGMLLVRRETRILEIVSAANE